MTTGELTGRRILVVEDEWFLADAIRETIDEAGGIVLGPVASVKEAMQLLSAMPEPPDAAALNVRVTDGDTYQLADELMRLQVPFCFASASGSHDLPSRFAQQLLVAKPYSMRHIQQALKDALSDIH